MPFISVNDANIHYMESGEGPETIVFAHGFLMDHSMFDAQVRTLGSGYRCVRYDHRGQGASEVTETGYDMDSLADDAARLIRALDCSPCHFVGLSMGGFVGLRLAIRHPELLRSLTLIGTSGDAEPLRSRAKYRLFAAIGRRFGFGLLAGRITALMFGRSFRMDPARQGVLSSWRTALLAAEREGILRAAVGVIERGGVHDQLCRIDKPVLIMVGEEDHTTPVRLARRLHGGIGNSRLVVIPRAGHSATIEEPDRVTAALLDFMVGLDQGRAAG